MVSEDIQGKVTRKICLSCSREFTGMAAACPHDGTMLVPVQQDQLIGTRLADRYQILSVIGHGGMGVVYKGRHELMERVVAIKMLQSNLLSDSMSVKRFQQEAKAASRLKHPNVITLYDFGVSPTGQPYLVMDYLEGESLADVIKREGHVGVDRSIHILTQAASALDHAHREGVLHRDLKPGNIMLVEQEGDKDFVKVVDFGVAKLMQPDGNEEAQRLTQTGEVCGSPVYMSPEQCMGAKLDNRSDIYSMGVLTYETLTGKLPLLGKSMVDTMSRHISEVPPSFSEARPDLYIPERLEKVVFKALAKAPEERFQTMAELEHGFRLAVPRPSKNPSLRLNTLELAAEEPVGEKTTGVKLRLAAVIVAVSVVVAVLTTWVVSSLTHPVSKCGPSVPGSRQRSATGDGNSLTAPGTPLLGQPPITRNKLSTPPVTKLPGGSPSSLRLKKNEGAVVHQAGIQAERHANLPDHILLPRPRLPEHIPFPKPNLPDYIPLPRLSPAIRPASNFGPSSERKAAPAISPVVTKHRRPAEDPFEALKRSRQYTPE